MLEVKGLSIEFDRCLIKNSNLLLNEGQMIALVGPSGSGKTSVLNAIARLDADKISHYIYNETDLLTNGKQEADEFKYQNIFYIKQDYVFLNSLTCFNHLMLVHPTYKKKDILDVLSMVSLEIKENIYPQQLSTGQKQRFCLAMAIASGAKIILCDELTASLDTTNRDKLLGILDYLAKKENKIIVLATHDEEVVNKSDVVYKIENQQLVRDKILEEKHSTLGATQKRQTPSIFHMLKCQLSSMKYQFGNSQLYCLFMILVIVISGLGFVFGSQQTINNQHIYSLLGNNQYYLTNKYVAVDSSEYVEYNPPFEEEFIKQLEIEPTLQAIYPYFQLPMNARYKDVNGVADDHLVKDYKVKINNNEVVIQQNRLPMFTIPYYEEDQMSNRCRGKTFDSNGVYLSLEAALSLGIESLEQPTTIEYTVLIPVASVDNNTIGFSNDAGNFENVEGLKNDLYKEYTLSLPIAGLLDMYFVSYGGGSNIYVPYAYLNDIFEKESPNYKYNTYVGYANNQFNLDDFSERMTLKNDHIDIFNLRSYFEEVDYSLLSSERIILIGDILLLATVVVLSFVYGMYLIKQNKKNYQVLTSYSFSKKQQRGYIIAGVLSLNLIIGVGSLLVGNIVYYFLRLRHYINPSYKYQFIYLLMILIVLLLSVLLPWISQLPTLFKKDVQND